VFKRSQVWGDRGRAGVIVALAAAAMVAAGCGGSDKSSSSSDAGAAASGSEGQTKSVKMLLSYPLALTWSPYLVAQEKGYFADEKLDVSVESANGASFVTQQLVAGQIDFGWAGSSNDVVAFSKDPGIRVLGCNHQRNIFRIIVPSASAVKSLADLKGKTIGIPNEGSGSVPVITAALKTAGLTGDVKVLAIGLAGPGDTKALEGDKVQAFAGGITDILTVGGPLKGGYRDITPTRFEPLPGDCLVTTQKALSDPEKKQTAIKLMRAWAKGSTFIMASPKAGLGIACKSQELAAQCKNQELAQTYMERFSEIIKPSDAAAKPMHLDPAGWTVVAQTMLEAGLLKSTVDPTDLVNSPDVQEVQKKYAEFDSAAIESDAKSAS
jgi:NitT/TauT family transport system substrate-binding protein